MIKEFKEWSKLIAMCVVGLTLILIVIAVWHGVYYD